MTEIKKRTLIDKCKDAYRAFRGKQIGSLTFGIDVKKCHECEYKNQDRIWYLCDRQACKNGCNPDCEHTSDIRHAKNFKDLINNGTYWEVEHETGESV